MEKDKKTKQMLYQKAFNNYSKALEFSRTMTLKAFRTVLSNRSNVAEIMGMIKETLEDLIEAELISSNEESINRIMNLINSNSKWFDYCVQIILEKSDNKSVGENLIKKLEEYVESNEEINPEIAASLEKLK
ncbi:hypothetical protein COA00_32260 [Bacillus cereus]|uniref:hypothetical protein n=1 Tax=Bacillus cereus TaxID=1396 RepID=UPI000BFBE895|nr:hypothetical protein [Bacillus cereus]PGP55227.1 hypothetical protein COA00_32260 [Bacillus cereus]